MEELLANLAGFGSQKMEDIGFFSFFVMMFISFASAMFISFLYVSFYQPRATGSLVHRAFPLLGISITAIFITIQFSLPLSLGLLGALSIVRFRTPIKEPEEIGFIMLVVATSLCCATFNMLFLSILLIVSVIALFIMKYSPRLMKGRTNDGMIIITLPADEYRADNKQLFEFLQKRVHGGRVDSISDNEGDAVISYSFARTDQSALTDLQNELKTLFSKARASVFFNRQGEL